MENIFYCGAAYGFLVAGILGIIFSNIRQARTRLGAQNRPLDTFPDSIQPNITPARIVRNSRMAIFSCIFWTVLLFLVFFGAIYVLKPLINLVIGMT